VTGRLAGGQLDADAGLVYVGDGRWYDAALSVFLQPDPFGGAPEAPESLNRYAAPGVSTLPTLGSVPGGGRGYANLTIGYTGLIATLSEINSTLNFNSGKAGLGLIIADKLAPRLLKASLVERLVEEKVLKRIPRYARLEKVIGAGLGATGVVQNRIGNNALFRTSDRFFSWLYKLNTSWIEETRLVPKIVPSDAPLGRLAGWLAKDRWGLPAPMADLGVGLVIDVGIQAVFDFGMLWRGELTGRQYAGRLGVEAFGSLASWGAGTVVAGAFGGPVGVIAAIAASVIYDLAFKPILYNWLNLNPRR
jgi:hypothetical protein